MISVNENPVTWFRFPGGEVQVLLPSLAVGPSTIIYAELYSSDLIVALLLTVNAIRHIRSDTAIKLVCPYFPYARQDRVCAPGEANSLSVMATLINGMGLESVTVTDPHSMATVDAVHDCKVVDMLSIISEGELLTKIKWTGCLLISPDAGAYHKVKKVSEALGCAMVSANKARDPSTGKIIWLSLEGDVKGRSCIILDDICDGGATFTSLGSLLKDRDALNVYLYVTHGIFSRGLDVLRPYFSHIYCYQTRLSEQDIDPSFLTILSKKENKNVC